MGRQAGDDSGSDIDALLPGTRFLLVAFATLTFAAFVALFVLAPSTDRYFAWTIAPPLTAAWLGAAYGSGCVLVLLALRVGVWSRIRVPFATVLVFTTLTLVASGLHLDKFHFGADGGVARFAAWFWMTIYVMVPVGMLVMLLLQERRAVRRPSTGTPLPRGLAAALAVQGGVLLLVGVALFASPDVSNDLWPWALTPLTARVVAAWLIALAVGIALALRDGDLGRLALAAVTYTVLGILELLVLARYPGEVAWGDPAAWGYLLVAASVLASGVYALARLPRTARTEVLT